MSNDLMRDRETLPTEDSVVTKILTTKDLVRALVQISFVPKSPKLPKLPPMIREFNTIPMAREFLKAAEPDPNQLGSPKQALAKRARFLHVQPNTLRDYTVNTEILPQGTVPNVVTEFTPDPDVTDTFGNPGEDSGLDLGEVLGGPSFANAGDERDFVEPDWDPRDNNGGGFDRGPDDTPDPGAEPAITWLVDPGSILSGGSGVPDPALVHDRPAGPDLGGHADAGAPLPDEAPGFHQGGVGEADDGGEDPWS